MIVGSRDDFLSVASLRLVSSGAATDRVTLFFPQKKPDDLLVMVL